MIYGNEPQRSYIKQFFERNIASKSPLFVLLIGQKGLGKTSFIENFAQEILDEFKRSDFLYIKDCSQELEKLHSIQIETPTAQKIISLSDGSIYENRGVREMNIWLQQSAISGKKVLFIENLERMTTAAMNAFLKTCEEPLSQRFIFATISSENEVLPTILSRALLVHFKLLTTEEMTTFLKDKKENLTQEKLNIILHMSGGKPGIAIELMKKMDVNPEIEELLIRGFSTITENKSKLSQIETLKKIKEIGFLEPFVNTIIDYFSENGDTQKAQMRINLKKFQSANIAEENSRWYTIS